ncbi:MAG: hypothetical protein ABI742_09400 [Gemmatimonadota bacterium]
MGGLLLWRSARTGRASLGGDAGGGQAWIFSDLKSLLETGKGFSEL